ncbi:MAG: hypothetical protein VB087_04455 [Candidatus Limiplasma sp.]|nr:hypothetical protein [Candidatus Limiplasma sp.]MEA5144542.1 hypothetical protein [Candidatus Limiplasma sp.]
MTDRSRAPARGRSCFFWLIAGLLCLLALGLVLLVLGILTGTPPHARGVWLA